MSWTETPQIPAGDQMAHVATVINKGHARFCELLVTADQAQEWLADGSPTVEQWLTARFDIDPVLGRRLARLARRLQDLPELRKRFGDGGLSLDVVDLLSEVATPDTEVDLLNEAEGRDLHDIARAASREKARNNKKSFRERDTQWLGTQWDLHRRKMRFRGELTGAEAHMVEDRLVDGARKIPRNLDTGTYDDWSTRLAHSLVELCATDSEGTAPVPTVVIHSDLSVFLDSEDSGVAEIGTGPVIASEVARALCCDSALEMTLESDGQPIGIGRRSRKIPGWLRRQVEYRDHHCQAPGCGRTVFLQIHHLVPWALGGTTDLDNLILLCWWHHLHIHEKGWHITRDVNGGFIFRKPDWTPHPPRST